MAIDNQFEDLVNALISAQSAVSDGTRDGGQRRWMDYLEIKEAGQFDLDAIAEIFSRAGLNDTFSKLMGTDGARVKEFHASKLSNDFMAGMERDHVARVRSRVATIMHGASRSRANGKSTGPLRRNTIDFITRVVDEDDATARAES